MHAQANFQLFNFFKFKFYKKKSKSNLFRKNYSECLVMLTSLVIIDLDCLLPAWITQF